MNDHDLDRLARLCSVVDHLEMHGRHVDAARLIKERDALLAPKPSEQSILNYKASKK